MAGCVGWGGAAGPCNAAFGPPTAPQTSLQALKPYPQPQPPDPNPNPRPLSLKTPSPNPQTQSPDQHFAFKTLTTADFRAYFCDYFRDCPAQGEVDWWGRLGLLLFVAYCLLLLPLLLLLLLLFVVSAPVAVGAHQCVWCGVLRGAWELLTKKGKGRAHQEPRPGRTQLLQRSALSKP